MRSRTLITRIYIDRLLNNGGNVVDSAGTKVGSIESPGVSHAPRRGARVAAVLGLTTLLAISAGPAHAAGSITVESIAAVEVTESDLDAGTFQVYEGTNGSVVDYHFFDNPGDTGTVFYFDGDGTVNFDWPLADSSNTWVDDVPGNGHVQRINEEAAARGMDLVFLDHPENRTGGRSWWNGVDGDAAAITVRELINASSAENVLLAGYSGGSEFFARHLLIDGTDWMPTNSAAVFMGGGGLAEFELTPATERMAQMSLVWAVGENDDLDAAVLGWSALKVSLEARDIFEQHGYQNAEIDILPGVNHYNYDFRGIVGEHADELLAEAPTGPADIELTSPVAPGQSSVSFTATGLIPGSVPTVTLTLADGTLVTAQPADNGAVASDGTYEGEISFVDFRVQPRTPYMMTVTDGSRAAEETLQVGKSARNG